MSATCPECGRPFGMTRKGVQTMTGRTVCADCHGDLLAAAAGVIANPDSPVEGAIATRGWFRLLRDRRRQR